MDKLKEIFEVELEVITPVHIGNGNEYINGIEIVNGKIFNINKLMNFFISDPLKIKELSLAIEKKTLSEFIGKNKNLIPDDLYFTFSSSDLKNQNIKKHIKTGMGDIYIPGSSIKGSIRTSIIQKLSNKNKNLIEEKLNKIWDLKGNKLKFADKEIIKRLLGNDPQTDLMRILYISDTEKIEKTAIKKVMVINSKRMNGKYIYYEMIPSGEKTRFRISIDLYLNKEENKERARIPLNNLNLENIKAIIKESTKDLLENHLKRSGNDGLREMKEMYLSLKKIFDELNDNETLLDMGAGIGWIGTTGDIIGDRINDDLRKKLKLAPKYLKFPFPKTRRLVYNNGKWMLPGWVKLKFITLEEAKKLRHEEFEKQKQKEVEAKAEQEKIERERKEQEERERKEKERLEAMSPEERLKEEIVKEIQSKDTQRISAISKKCLAESTSKDVFGFLKEQLVKYDEWKPKGGKQKKNRMKKRNEDIEKMINQ